MNLTSQKTFQLVHKILKGNENDMTVLKEMVMDFDNLAHNGFNLKPEIKQHWWGHYITQIWSLVSGWNITFMRKKEKRDWDMICYNGCESENYSVKYN